MSQRVYLNNFKTTLSADITSSTDTLPVANTSAVSSQLTALTNGQYFLVTLDDGVKYEVVEVRAFSSGILGSCVRGRENTTGQVFSQGTRVEARVTAGTLSAFARLTDRMADISSVDALPVPGSADANSYLTASTDDSGTPIIAVKAGSLWRFPSHPTAVRTGTLASPGTTTSVNLGSTTFLTTSAVSTGGYLIQFTSGVLAGTCRRITSATGTSVSWATSLTSAPVAGVTYSVYQSTSVTLSTVSSIQDDSTAIALIFSE